AQRGPALSRATVATSSRIVRVSQEDERPTTWDRCVYKQERRAAQGADNPLRDLTTGCWVPLRRLQRGPMELSAPIRYATRNRKRPKRGRKRLFNAAIHALRMRVERTFAWEDKFKRLLLRFERIQQRHYGMKLLAYTLINLRKFCGT